MHLLYISDQYILLKMTHKIILISLHHLCEHLSRMTKAALQQQHQKCQSQFFLCSTSQRDIISSQEKFIYVCDPFIYKIAILVEIYPELVNSYNYMDIPKLTNYYWGNFTNIIFFFWRSFLLMKLMWMTGIRVHPYSWYLFLLKYFFQPKSFIKVYNIHFPVLKRIIWQKVIQKEEWLFSSCQRTK